MTLKGLDFFFDIRGRASIAGVVKLEHMSQSLAGNVKYECWASSQSF